ncbi:carboxypeptidase S [Rhodocollybia butyracea]|uniref:Carboxypeptidase S n=1 Tax=Rhodocollybia butyracea TaxID=206335 RepID=A0A9P5Q288_9AGAR|nr:carboxypeptidase S [Rhodocollybia butyracea]
MYPSGSLGKTTFSTSNTENLKPRCILCLVGLTAIVLLASQFVSPIKQLHYSHYYTNTDEPCIQSTVLNPINPLWKSIGEIIDTNAFKNKAVDWLAGAVRIPTESYDDFGPIGSDPRWETFKQFHEYLLKAFPLVHATLSLAKINTYGLLYEWTGTDTSLKPVLLTAHQDVVPVDPSTTSEWTFPPYSGHFDGTRIWGRGSSDDKSGLIGLLSAIETMLENGFVPERTFVLAFGCDEEATGQFGALQLSNAMRSIYGQNAFEFIVDEGGGFSERYGTVFATPGVAEKGSLDLRVDVASPGGHSSVPPSHTTIGILSRLLVELEKNPYPVEMSTQSVFYSTLQCYASYGKTIPSDLRDTIVESAHSKKALKRLGDMIFTDPANAALVGTTQAIDLIQGGVKANALPEQAYAVVNQRISTLSSVTEAISHSTNTLKPLADKFNLMFISFGETLSRSKDANASSPPAYGTLVLSDAFNTSLAPAPITPTSGANAGPYRLLAGTIRATYNAHRGLDSGADTNIIVAPGMPTGNTDTRYYWDLSDGQIFRYNHRNSGDSGGLASGVHTVDENLPIETLLEIIRFFTSLIMNANEARFL